MTELASDLYMLVAVLGLALCVAYCGQPVLCQGAFVSAGAFGVAHLLGVGLPLAAAVLLAVAIAAVLGGIVAVLTIHLPRAHVALSTWAIAWLAYTALQSFHWLSNGADGLSLPVPIRLHSGILHLSFTLTEGVHLGVAAVLCAGVIVALARWERGVAGLQAAALREGPALAGTLGVPVRARRAVALICAAALGGLAGAGIALLASAAAPADVSPLLSLQLFVAALIGGAAPRVWAPVAGWAVVAAIPHLAGSIAAAAEVPAVGVDGVLTAALLGLVVVLRGPVGRLLPIVRGRPRAASDTSDAGAVVPGTLVARGVSVRLGDATILDGVDLEVRPGEIHALVGANGSGKTTLLRVLSGTLRPTAGQIEFRDADITRTATARRVRAGVTRTFQRPAELPSLTPYRQVRLAALARGRDADGGWALELTDLDGHADDDPRSLTGGEQQLLQVARAAATGAAVLLLDEPAAGMSADERQRLRVVLRRLTERGVGLLLVEHDSSLVADVADRASLLDGGRVVAHGTPHEVVPALTGSGTSA
ncbi:hypothetical protein GCM10023322_31840 [Rugosimonospora acidiphila]|uniref:ABC transporter domain-containing protein n=1 Tax=Rugosimonospora acidiphila TaxID=556531 RepID=A0ABP9RS94_9ACTN